MIGRLHMRPDLSVDEVIGEYASAFGKAAPAIRDYLAYWENFTAGRTAKVAPGMYTIVEKMPELFTDDVLGSAQKLLDAAARLAAQDSPEVRARVQFLSDGITHVRLTRDAVRAVSEARAAGRIDSAPDLVRTINRLREFRRRAAPKHQDWTEWSDLWEIRMGDQTGFLLTRGLQGRIPIAALPLQWGFRFDPEKRGERERWFETPSGEWMKAAVGEARPQLPAKGGKRAGPMWYETSFASPKGTNPVTLLFADVNGPCRIWLNGKLLGERTGGSFELPGTALVAGVNRLAVRVDSSGSAPGLIRPVWILAGR